MTTTHDGDGNGDGHHDDDAGDDEVEKTMLSNIVSIVIVRKVKWGLACDRIGPGDYV